VGHRHPAAHSSCRVLAQSVQRVVQSRLRCAARDSKAAGDRGRGSAPVEGLRQDRPVRRIQLLDGIDDKLAVQDLAQS